MFPNDALEHHLQNIEMRGGQRLHRESGSLSTQKRGADLSCDGRSSRQRDDGGDVKAEPEQGSVLSDGQRTIDTGRSGVLRVDTHLLDSGGNDSREGEADGGEGGGDGTIGIGSGSGKERTRGKRSPRRAAPRSDHRRGTGSPLSGGGNTRQAKQEQPHHLQQVSSLYGIYMQVRGGYAPGMAVTYSRLRWGNTCQC